MKILILILKQIGFECTLLYVFSVCKCVGGSLFTIAISVYELLLQHWHRHKFNFSLALMTNFQQQRC